MASWATLPQSARWTYPHRNCLHRKVDTKWGVIPFSQSDELALKECALPIKHCIDCCLTLTIRKPPSRLQGHRILALPFADEAAVLFSSFAKHAKGKAKALASCSSLFFQRRSLLSSVSTTCAAFAIEYPYPVTRASASFLNSGVNFRGVPAVVISHLSR